MHARERLLRDPRRGARVLSRRRPLSRHLRGRLLQPADDAMWPGAWSRTRSLVNLPNWLCLCVPDRRRRVVRPRPASSSCDYSPGARPAARRARAHGALPRPRGARRRASRSALRVAWRSRSIWPPSRRRSPRRGLVGPARVRSALDGRVVNSGVARYGDLASRHLDRRPDARSSTRTRSCSRRETTQSRIRIAEAARTRVVQGGARIPAGATRTRRGAGLDRPRARGRRRGRRARSRSRRWLRSTRRATRRSRSRAARRAGWSAPFAGFDDAARGARASPGTTVAPVRRSRSSDHERRGASGDAAAHLPPAADVSEHTIDLDVGVPARGLHGEAYRGHIFWDELFIFPFLNLRLPELTRALLLYRYRRLTEARRAARRGAATRGRCSRGRAASNGREESQTLHLNPTSGRWLPDNSHRQRHINVAIAYNVWLYYQATERHRVPRLLRRRDVRSRSPASGPASRPTTARIDRYEIRGVDGARRVPRRLPGRRASPGSTTTPTRT